MKKEEIKKNNKIQKAIHSENGITLIALVITIIILIILAGVTLNLVLGENGLLVRSQKAATDTQIAQDKEELNLKYGEYQVEQATGSQTPETFLEFLDRDIKDYQVEYPDESNHEIGDVTLETRKYSIDTSNGGLDIQYLGKGEEANKIPRIIKMQNNVTTSTIEVRIEVSGEFDEIEYAIALNGEQIGESVKTTGTTHTFGNLKGGETYTIIAIVRNKYGSTYKTATATPMSLNELVKGKAKFVIEPKEKWQKEVTVTIETTYKPVGQEQLEYSTDDGDIWTKYTTEFKISDNITVYGRYYNPTTEEESDHFSITIDIIDKESPVVDVAFNNDEMKLNVKVKDEQSGLASIVINRLTSETENGAIETTEIKKVDYENPQLDEQNFEETIKAAYQEYLRGYEIIAIDKAGNENKVTVNNLSIRNLSMVIMNYQDLKDFAATVNGGETFEGQKVEVGCDFTAGEMDPIGNKSKQFKGTFDGNGHTITELVINDNSEDGSCVGMFKYAGEGSTITNLKLENANVTGDTWSSHIGTLVGATAGNVSNIGIVNCTVKSNNDSSVGGIIGQLNGNEKVVENCYVDGGNIIGVGSGNICGIVGVANETNIIKNTYCTASLQRNDTLNEDYIYGISNKGIIQNSYFAGTMKNVGEGSCYGIANSSNIQNCYWSEEKTGANKGEGNNVQISRLTHKEGLEGFDFENVWAIEEGESLPYLKNLGKTEGVTKALEGYDIMNGIGTKESPYEIKTFNNLKEVKYELTAEYKLVANITAGEMDPIGNNNTKFEGTFDGNGHTITGLVINDNSEDGSNVGMFKYAGEGSTITNLKLENANVTGDTWSSHIGTLVGRTYGNVSNIGIVNCTVKSNNDSSVGGIIGQLNGTEKVVENCYVDGGNIIGVGSGNICGIVGVANETNIIKNTYCTASLQRNDTLNEDSIYGISKSGTIQNSYFAGTMKNVGEGTYYGIVRSGTATNCFWNSDKLSNAKGQGTGKSTSEMQLVETYSSWDTSIWNIEAGKYPTLKINWKVN